MKKRFSAKLFSALVLSISFFSVANAASPKDELNKRLVLGVNGAFLTGDLFNVFVFFEVLLIALLCLFIEACIDNAVQTSDR